jgi:hypothetical protein
MLVRRGAVLWFVTIAVLLGGGVVAGCAGSTKPTPIAGCKGLPTARRSQSFLVLFGAVDRLSQAQACAQLGAPQRIWKGRGGVVHWTYGSSSLEFKGTRVVGWTNFESGSPNSTFSVSQSVQAQK